MGFSRGKVQVLYNYLPGAIFPHDIYGYCKVTGITLREDASINRQAVAETISDTLRYWHHDWQRIGFAETRDEASFAANYVIGTPVNVQFVPYPKMLQCRSCRRVYPLETLEKNRRNTPGRCPAEGCGGTLGQFQFIQGHNCGRLEGVYLDTRGCRIHGTRGLYFDDTGRVMTARWRCHLCGGAELSRMRQTPCRCDYSAHAAPNDSARRMRVFAVSDPAVFKPWVVPFVNFDQTQLVDLSKANAKEAILARLWNLVDMPAAALVEQSQKASSGEDSQTEELIREIEALQPDNPHVLEYRRRQREAQLDTAELDVVRRAVGADTDGSIYISRRMSEQVALLDTLNSVTVGEVAGRLRRGGEDAAADRIGQAETYAADKLGLCDMRALEDFPVGLCAMGFTRVTKSAADSVLNPFPQIEARTPLYTVTTTTEALYFRLDPVRVVRWLVGNRIATGTPPGDETSAWAWLYRNCEGLRATPQQPEYQQLPAGAAVRTLLHSVSHVLLRNIEWSGYAAQSLGEYLLPEGLACVLYANRYTDTTVGGLVTLFEQELFGWLEASFQGGLDCVFDPFCAENGSSCVGCLHREFNCPTFNRELSRSTLYGGTIKQDGLGALPFSDIAKGYWE